MKKRENDHLHHDHHHHHHGERRPYRELAEEFIQTRTIEITKPILQKIEIRIGQCILDYACGPGVYSWVAAEMVGESGFVYTADIAPEAGDYVKTQMENHHLTNYQFFQTDCYTPIADHSLDLILLFDAYHSLENPKDQLAEFARIAKKTGRLAILVDHLDPDEVRNQVEDTENWKIQTIEENLLIFTNRSKEVGRNSK